MANGERQDDFILNFSDSDNRASQKSSGASSEQTPDFVLNFSDSAAREQARIEQVPFLAKQLAEKDDSFFQPFFENLENVSQLLNKKSFSELDISGKVDAIVDSFLLPATSDIIKTASEGVDFVLPGDQSINLDKRNQQIVDIGRAGIVNLGDLAPKGIIQPLK